MEIFSQYTTCVRETITTLKYNCDDQTGRVQNKFENAHRRYKIFEHVQSHLAHLAIIYFRQLFIRHIRYGFIRYIIVINVL